VGGALTGTRNTRNAAFGVLFSRGPLPHNGYVIAQRVSDSILPDLITTSTAGQILRRGESTVRLWRNSGRLRIAARTPSGLVLYWRRDVEALRDELQRELYEAAE
jgi:hypothetical protein